MSILIKNLRKQDIGPEKMKAYQDEWKALIDAVRAEMKKGTDPTSAPAQKYAENWSALLNAFSGDNTGIEQAKAQMYKNEPKMREHFGFDPEMWAYVGKMMGHFRSNKWRRG